ncbi:UNVERIFIED_CONTAM: hypothetical protein GTU68_004331 [Idotea baltica]|nr:hypothetical protein [Idotea baltica]
MTKVFDLQTSFAPAGQQPAAIESLCSGIDDGLAYQTLLGVTGSGKTFTIANIIQKQQRPAIILAPNKTLAAQLYGELQSVFPTILLSTLFLIRPTTSPRPNVRPCDLFIEKDSSINIEQMRLSATKALFERKDTIIVATVSSIYGLGDPEQYHEMVLHLSRGEIIDQRKVLRRLAELQYQRNDVELKRGTYRVRGEIIDIYPADSERDAIRVELFDEEIEALSFFDPLTGEVVRKVPRLTIYPKTHYVTPRERLLAAVDEIKEELKERLEQLRDAGKLVEAQRLQQRTQFDMEMIYELGYCSGIENYSRYLSGRGPGEPPPCLFDYLPKGSLLFIDESHVTVPQLGAMYKGDRSRKENLVNFGFRLLSALDNRPLKFEEFELLAPQAVFVSATPGNYEKAHADSIVELVVRPTGLLDPQVEVRPVKTQVDDVLSEINIRVERNERVLITTLTKRMSEDLTDYLADHDVKVRYLHSDVDTVERSEIIRDLRLGIFDVIVGINLLREGLDMPEVSLVAILDADKEGFLRSDRSLIQTIGRAARNLEGRAILYGDTITGSMQRAIDETNRRREVQQAHNEKHGITPVGITKSIRDGRDKRRGRGKEAAAKDDFSSLSTAQATKKMSQIEKQMYECARNLEFEQAAQLRDQLDQLRENVFRSEETAN